MPHKKVLIFPAGTEIAFEILNALKYSKFVTLYGGTSAEDHSEFVYERLIKGLPYVDDPTFIDALNKVIDENGIDCVYPAHDSATVVFSERAEEIHAQVIVPDAQTADICRSKAETYRYLAEEAFIPKTYSEINAVAEEDYPVFVKPTVGQGSNGAQKISNRSELEIALAKDPSLVICEYLPGMEYTVDCFTDKNGKLLIAKMRDRSRIRTGISVRSQSYPADEQVQKIAEIINSKFHFIGAWFFQLKKNTKGEYRLLEISPRIPGTMGLSRNCGINYPMLTLFTFWGYDVGIIDNGYDIMLDRAFYSAYKINLEYEDIYLDFDDTLIVNGKVNQDLMRFLYQAKNEGKRIHLLSKHLTDMNADLNTYCISPLLFADIQVIDPQDEKTRYITSTKAIFIDDSFAERKKVSDVCKIPVFDLDMIESLIDWRR